MPISEIAFVVSHQKLVDYEVTSTSGRVTMKVPEPIKTQVETQAVRTFGEGAKFLGFAKSKSSTIRFFKKRGIPVIKEAGRFFLDADKARELVWVTIDVPQDYIIKMRGGTPGEVDLTGLEQA